MSTKESIRYTERMQYLIWRLSCLFVSRTSAFRKQTTHTQRVQRENEEQENPCTLMFTNRSRVKWIILSYCFIVMVCRQCKRCAQVEPRQNANFFVLVLCFAFLCIEKPFRWYLLFVFSFQFLLVLRSLLLLLLM